MPPDPCDEDGLGMVPELHHQSSGGSLSGSYASQAGVGTTNDAVHMLASSLKDRMKMVGVDSHFRIIRIGFKILLKR